MKNYPSGKCRRTYFLVSCHGRDVLLWLVLQALTAVKIQIEIEVFELRRLVVLW
jgi:hypothetical protein